MVAKIATGRLRKNLPPQSAAAELGQKRGKARAAKLSPRKRKEIARKGAESRWD
jgi:general stress protein YciG